MAKIKGTVFVTSNESKKKYEIKGIYHDNQLIYKEDNILVTISLFDNKLVMKRENEEYKAVLSLEENKLTKNKYTIKNIGDLYISIETKEIVIKDKLVLVKYLVVDSEITFCYELNYTILEECV